MDDPRPVVRVGGLPEGLAPEEPAREQAVDQRAALVAPRRVHDEAGRLVHHHHVVVDVQHVERDLGVGEGRGAPGRVGADHEGLALAHLGAGVATDAAHGDAPRVDPAPELRARQLERIGQRIREKAIESRSGLLAGDDELERRLARRILAGTLAVSRVSSRHQSLDLMCPLALMRMSTSARS